MQIFLTKNETFFITSSVKVVFDGKKLRTFLGNKIVKSLTAKIGESFYVTSKGKGRIPKITKIALPASKGSKISYFLFDYAEKASTKQEVLDRVNSLKCKSTVLIVRDSYAVLFSQKKNKDLKPIISYVSDNISDDYLRTLISDTLDLKELHCPEEFIFTL